MERLRMIVILLMFLSESETLFCQVSIAGNIRDGDEALPSVTVLLLSGDSTLIQGVVTDSVGKFFMDRVMPGYYILSASIVGYTRFDSDIEIYGESLVLPEIILEVESTALNEVIVSGERQRFDHKTDRLVINLEGSITSSGNSVLEVLQKSPGVFVNRQNNTIAINGKTGVRVMINNKVTQLPPDAVVQMLDGMSAANVESLELITAPSSAQDAEGNGGIINIVTKVNEDFGTIASLGLMAGARWAENFGANLNVHHRGKAIAYFLDYSIILNHNLHILKSARSRAGAGFPYGETYSHRENRTTQQNLSAGFEWQVFKNIKMNLLLSGYDRNWRLSADTYDESWLSADSSIKTNMKVEEANVWRSATASLAVQTKIDSRNEVGFTLDYLFYHNDNPSGYDNNSVIAPDGAQTLSKIQLEKITPIRSFVAKVDYHFEMSPVVVWEAGIKSVSSTLDNDVVVQKMNAGSWIDDPAFTSYSTLNESIYAGYISGRFQVRQDLQINGGLRYEYTHSAIGSLQEKELVNRKYGYLFPAISAKQSLGDEKSVELSYTRRITRPTYNDIAPYVFFWSPNTFSAGNTSLYPALSDAFSAAYHVRQFTFSIQYSHIKNEIAMLQPEIDAENNLIYRSQNLRYLNTFSGSLNYSASVVDWWELQSSVTAQYQVALTSFYSNWERRLYGININVVNIFKLPRNFSAEISATYQSATLSGISEFLPVGSLNAGIQKSFGEKGIVRLSIDDILYTNNWRIKTEVSETGLTSYFNYDWHNQFIRVTYSRSLGNSKLKSLKLKTGSDEERRRISD